MRHEDEITTVAAIINGIDSRADRQWYEIMGIEIPGVVEAVAAEDFDRASELEAVWLREHSEDRVEVSWPEHVITPSYDSDASYRLLL